MQNYKPPPGMEKTSKTKGKAGGATASGKATKKGKAKKDPNAPKRGKTSFMFYSTEMRAKIKADNPDLSFGDLGKKIGEMFKALPPAEKAKYEKKAADAKVKYQEEMKKYKQSSKAEPETDDDDDDDASGDGGVEEDVEDDDDDSD